MPNESKSNPVRGYGIFQCIGLQVVVRCSNPPSMLGLCLVQPGRNGGLSAAGAFFQREQYDWALQVRLGSSIGVHFSLECTAPCIAVKGFDLTTSNLRCAYQVCLKKLSGRRCTTSVVWDQFVKTFCIGLTVRQIRWHHTVSKYDIAICFSIYISYDITWIRKPAPKLTVLLFVALIARVERGTYIVWFLFLSLF